MHDGHNSHAFVQIKPEGSKVCCLMECEFRLLMRRTKVVDDALRVVGEGQRLRRLELQREVLPQRADQQELVRLLGDLRGKPVR